MFPTHILLWWGLVACSGEDSAAPAPTVTCGDGEQAAGEDCDDGNTWGGDGCSPTCQLEEGTLETEPNDTFTDSTAITPPLDVTGALPIEDEDCYSLDVAEQGAVSGRMLPDPDTEACAEEAIIELFDGDGDRIAVGLPDAETGCGALSAETNTFARYLTAGTYHLCVQGAFGEAIPTYTLSIETADSCDGLPPLTPDPTQDIDLDGLADVCDDDDDDDGVSDDSDNCPETPNGLNMRYAFDTSTDGFIRQWLRLGPFTSGESPENCEPSPDSFTGERDADAEPVLGEAVDGDQWTAILAGYGGGATISFLNYYSVAAPREAYVFAWIYAPDERDGELTLGADDGFRIWWDGAELAFSAGCQGVSVDAFRYPLTLSAGWHPLLIKVRDNGGGWGVVARFYDAAGEPMTDLEVSLDGQPWIDDQRDQDGDGIGDVCDPRPGPS